MALTRAWTFRASLATMRNRVAAAGLTTLMALSTLMIVPGGASAGTELPAGESTHELRVGDTTRTYRVYVPSSLPSKRVPVVVVLHGGFGTGAGAARQGNWDAAAEEHGFLEIAPDGVGRAWNAGAECCGLPARVQLDDVGFVLAVLDDVAASVDIDPKRVYATGLSNGGMMSYRLGCEASARFAAIAPVGATVITDPCRPKKPVSLLHVHGLADQNLPFEGGVPTKSFQRNPPSYAPVREGIGTFVRTDGCRRTPRVRTSGVVTAERWRGCDAGTGVELITIADGGHSWPGGMRISDILDPPSDALDATATIWKFFAAHPRD